VRTKSGKTIEVDNTDAEGRIVLSDALYHASTLKPDQMISLATLTGACVVALGDNAAGILGTNQELIDAIRASGERSGERAWQLPLWDEHDRDIDSHIADYRNMGLPKMAGASAAAALLKQFTGTLPWAHLDIAGVASADVRDRFLTKKNEGTAFGVRLLVDYLRS
jgi:leucyl aminopeptidase